MSALKTSRACWAMLPLLLVAGGMARAESPQAPLEIAEVPAAVKAREFASTQDWVRQFAEQEEWSTAPRQLKSYWRVERKLKDTRKGTFLLGRMARSGAPQGGEHIWMLLYESPAGVRAIGPLATQSPYSNESQQKVRAADMKLQGETAESAGLLWVELVDELSQYVEDVDDFRKTSTRSGFAFRVDSDGTLVCVAYEVPLSITMTLKDKQEGSSSLKVSFPKPGVMKVEAGEGKLTSVQQSWVGAYDVTGRPQP